MSIELLQNEGEMMFVPTYSACVIPRCEGKESYLQQLNSGCLGSQQGHQVCVPRCLGSLTVPLVRVAVDVPTSYRHMDIQAVYILYLLYRGCWQ